MNEKDLISMDLKEVMDLREENLQKIILFPKDSGEWTIAKVILKKVNIEIVRRILIDLLQDF